MTPSYGDDPASKRAQALAVRWMELAERSTGGDLEIKAGIIKAWKDRRNRPVMAQPYSAAFNLEEVVEFIANPLAYRAGKHL